MKSPRRSREDDDHIISRSGNQYVAERAQRGQMIVGYGKTVKAAISDCEQKAA